MSVATQRLTLKNQTHYQKKQQTMLKKQVCWDLKILFPVRLTEKFLLRECISNNINNLRGLYTN